MWSISSQENNTSRIYFRGNLSIMRQILSVNRRPMSVEIKKVIDLKINWLWNYWNLIENKMIFATENLNENQDHGSRIRTLPWLTKHLLFYSFLLLQF